jgi:hypothetical protein
MDSTTNSVPLTHSTSRSVLRTHSRFVVLGDFFWGATVQF